MLAKYPLIPLKNIIAFPGIIIPIFVGRKKSLQAIEHAKKNDNKVIICLQKLGVDNPLSKDILPIGVLAELVKITPIDSNTSKVLIHGEQRVKIDKFLPRKTFFEVEYSVLEDKQDFSSKAEQKELMNIVYDQLEVYLSMNKNIPTEVVTECLKNSDAINFVNTIAHFLMFPINEKQNLLAADSLKERLNVLLELIMKEIDIIRVEERLHTVIKDNIEKSQREHYLKEKVKAIKAELGEGSGEDYDEIQDYRQQIESANMPEGAKTKVFRELNKLIKMSNLSAEAGIIKTYLEWVLELPWNEVKQRDFDISEVGELLNKNHFGLKKVKERIHEFLAVYKLTGDIQGSILCLVGPGGVGKTSIARSIAEVMGREFVKISLGGMNDEAELRGHRRTYVGAMPGRIIQTIHNVKTKNPVILLDEIDKISKNFQSNPAAVLLEVLDKEQNRIFYDYYMELPFDLSEVLFIATANNTFDMPVHLVDRMELIQLSGYSNHEKLIITKQYLIPRVLKAHGVQSSKLTISDSILTQIIMFYTREAGLRELERCLSAIARKVALKLLESEKKQVITDLLLLEMLGHPKYKMNLIPDKPTVGISLGLAYTAHGGEVMPIEVSVFNGNGELKLTGKMGDVMQESSMAAISYVRLIAKKLGLKKDFYKSFDIHIHIPENAIPKDGPSAGIAIAAALISAYTKRPVRTDIAMTGEIALHGQVLPIGGVKEKLLAAERHNIKEVFVPFDNLMEVEEVKKDLTNPPTIIGVKNVSEILAKIFTKESNKSKKQNKWL